jgi:sigma-B regulation protein RsbU (phosphoserine phosphatase)
VSELAHWSSPGALLVALNAAVEASWPSDVFVSAICLLLDPRTGHGTIAVAGQVAPIVRGPSCCRTLEVNAGPALGLLAEQTYPELRFSLGADDVLVAVTDGVTDRFATGSDLLGTATLARLLDGGPAHPTEVCDSLLSATRGFGQHDDATVLAIAPALHGIATPLVSAPEEISLAA